MKTILFDLDGTLLPMDYDSFQYAYFSGLCKAFPQWDKKTFMGLILSGVDAMMENDGSQTNREAFAQRFEALSGVDYLPLEPQFYTYYETEFQNCVKVCGVTDLSRKIVETLRSKGYTAAIATNPLFPEIATFSRLRWLGLEPESFPLVTTFEESRHCKPNPDYYLEVCRRLGVEPSACIMIGNDVEEDGAAAKVGMEVMLVTDHLINNKALPTDKFWSGSLADLLAWAESL